MCLSFQSCDSSRSQEPTVDFGTGKKQTHVLIGGLVEGDQVGVEASQSHHRPEGEKTHHNLQHSAMGSQGNNMFKISTIYNISTNTVFIVIDHLQHDKFKSSFWFQIFRKWLYSPDERICSRSFFNGIHESWVHRTYKTHKICLFTSCIYACKQ